jgi:hypothetical protein
MYTQYRYTSGATVANVLSDLVALLTGETNKANLSASCDQANTTITSTIAAGWTLHDGSSGTNKQVVKAAYTDDPSNYKYVEVEMTSTTIALYLYETFDSGTHTGTNKSGYTSYQQVFSTSQTNTIHLFATAKYIVLFTGYSNDTNWGDNSYHGCYLISEMTRLPPWNTVASGMPSVMICHTGPDFQTASNKYAYFVRARNKANVILTDNGTAGNIYLLGGISGSLSYFPSAADAIVYDDTGNPQIPTLAIYAGRHDIYSMPLGEISSDADLWVIPAATASLFDTVVKNSINYKVIQLHNTTTNPKLIVREG